MFFRRKIFGWLVLLSSSVAAQPNVPFKVQVAPADSGTFTQLTRDFLPHPEAVEPGVFQLLAPDTVSTGSIARRLIRHLRDQSYLTASLDTFEQKPGIGRLHLGPPIRWISLRPLSLEDGNWLEAAGFREKKFTEKPLRYDLLLALEKNILEQFENNGYPFAAVRLDSIRLDSTGGVSAMLAVQRNRFFTLKQIKVNGDVKLPPAYLPNYLGLRAGQPYSRAQVLRLREQLRTLLFVEPTGNPSVTFAGSEATVNLFLQKKRASRFDFIIGLLPQPDAAGNANRLLLTGSLSAAFMNALNLGERLSVELERLRPETQKLDVQAGLPYLIGTPFGVEGRLSIFKRDSTWVDAQADLGVQYLFQGTDFIKFFWENKSSTLQKVDTVAVRASRRLPANLDLRQNGFGIESSLNRLDYRFNPRKGWAATIKGVAGFNAVLRNNQIEALQDTAFNFASLYDTVEARSTRFRVELRTEVYLPVFVRSTIKLSLRSGGIFSEKPVYANEQYRLGGNKLLRGFDEESLFATRWAVATAEFRLLLGQNSFLSAFTDYGYVENITNRTRLFLRPWGVGAGLNFETQAGIFGISIAVGRRDAGEGMDLRATKFHLGYVSLF
jgi:outer membrane protein assembly factor BamA